MDMSCPLVLASCAMVSSALVDALRRYVHLVTQPEAEWNLVVAEKPPLAEIVFPFTVIGLAVSLLAGLLGALIRVGEHSILLEVVLRPVVDAGTVAAFAAASGLLARRFDAVRPSMGEAAALYSSAGLWMSSVLGFVPVSALGWLWFLVGVAYTGYLYHLALDVAVGVPGHARLKAFVLSMAGLVVAGSALRAAMQLVVG
jgi:hypothetical protein